MTFFLEGAADRPGGFIAVPLVQPKAALRRQRPGRKPLRRIAEVEPEVAHCVLPVLKFRTRVLRELERLAAESLRIPRAERDQQEPARDDQAGIEAGGNHIVYFEKCFSLLR